MSWTTVGAASATVAACAALVLVTLALDSAAGELKTALRSITSAAEIENQLLVHRLGTDPTSRSIAEARLAVLVEEAGETVQSDAEAQALGRLRRSLAAYRSARPEEASRTFAASLEAVRLLGLVNQRYAREMRALADRTVGRVHAFALPLAAAVAACAAIILYWLRRQAFRPTLAIAAAVDELSAGRLGARAPEEGPEELRQVARTFNRMAASLWRVRTDQLQYIAGVVHDLRHPLTAVQLAAAYASPDRPLPPEARVRELFRIIDRQLKRLNSMVGDVLNVVQIEAGAMELHLADHDVVSLMREAVELFEAMAPLHVFELDVPAAPLVILCDGKRVEQVFNNLLSNAVKYSPAGSRVTIRIRKQEGRAEVRVSDEGPGIAPEDRERIFEAFRRGSPAHEAIAGVGLGLYASRRIVEAHGGRLELESEPGLGSTFAVALPERPQVAKSPTAAAGTSSGMAAS